MANTSISNLAAGAAVSATDVVPNVQTAGVGPVKTTAAQLKTFMSASPTLVTPNIGVAAGTSVTLGANGGTGGSVKLFGATSGDVTINTAAAAGTATTFTLPATNGTNKYALTTNGSGVSSWGQIDLTAAVTGVLPIANGGTNNSAAYSSGYVMLSDGTKITQNTASNRQLFYDTTNGYLGVGTATPGFSLELAGINGIGVAMRSTGSTGCRFRTYINSTTEVGVFGFEQRTSVSTVFFETAGAERFYVNASTLAPSSDNAYTCGASGARWSAVWAANGTIQTSDSRTKTDIVPSPLGLDFIAALNPVAYKFKVGRNEVTANPNDPANPILTPVRGARQHFGLISQEVKAALPAGVDFGGWVLTDVNNPDSEQGLRYDQFIAPLIKAVQELKAEFDAYKAAHP